MESATAVATDRPNVQVGPRYRRRHDSRGWTTRGQLLVHRAPPVRPAPIRTGFQLGLRRPVRRPPSPDRRGGQLWILNPDDGDATDQVARVFPVGVNPTFERFGPRNDSSIQNISGSGALGATTNYERGDNPGSVGRVS